MSIRHLAVIGALITGVVFAGSSADAACVVPPFTATYEVEALGLDTGSSHDDVRRDGANFAIETTADAHVLFYRRNEVEKTSGRVVGGNLEPRVYSWGTPSGSKGTAKVPEGVLDTLTLGVQLRADLARNKIPTKLRVADKTSSVHDAEVSTLPGTKKVKTKIGDFDTRVVALEGLPLIREFWFEEKGDHRLVRIVVHDSAVGEVNITLSAYDEKTGPCVIGE